jgi:hypothetical protein
MLRDICSGLALAALTAALYALGMHFGPLNWSLGEDAFDLLVVVGSCFRQPHSLSNSSARVWTGGSVRTWPGPTIALVCSRKPFVHERSG